MNTAIENTTSKINWKQVGLYLGLTFAFTIILDLSLKLAGGYGGVATALLLQLQMFLPAFFAIVLGLFVFKDSPFHISKVMEDGRRDRARGFFFLFIVLTLVFVALAAVAAISPASIKIVSTLAILPMFLGLVGWLLFRFIGGRESFARANMRNGRFVDWLVYGGAFLLFIALQTGLNALFRLGAPIDTVQMAAKMGLPFSGITLQLVMGVQMIVEGSLIGLVIAFGEEYGWRGYLQSQLIKMGKKRGVLILGLIWAAWHYPVIWMGHNYPGQPVLGTILMTIFCVLMSFVLGHVVLKTGGVWLAAFLHALLDQAFNFSMAFVYKPNDMIFSFGAGIYGMACLAVVVFFLLRDPVWKDGEKPVLSK